MRMDESLSMEIDWTEAGDEVHSPSWSKVEVEGKGAGIGMVVNMETGSGFAVRYARGRVECRED